MHADLVPPLPPTFGQPWALQGKPPLNGGGPKKPDPPPPAPAPVRADAVDGTADAARLAARKRGLRRTFLQELMGERESARTLGVPLALGQ